MNILPLQPLVPSPTVAELAELGVARVSWATRLHRALMAHFGEQLAGLRG